jgi:chromosome segregation ATPase
MADAATITAVVMAAAAAVTAATPVALARRKTAKQHDSTTLDGFTALNQALERRVTRLQEDMDRLREEYERRLTSAQDRIRELESELGTLRRAVRGDPP